MENKNKLVYAAPETEVIWAQIESSLMNNMSVGEYDPWEEENI